MVNHLSIIVTLAWHMMNEFMDAIGQTSCFIFAIQKVNLYSLHSIFIWIILHFSCRFHHVNVLSHIQLSLVSRAQPKSIHIHHQHVSGHIHDLPFPAINIIWLRALTDIPVWFHAAKAQFSTSIISPAKSWRNKCRYCRVRWDWWNGFEFDLMWFWRDVNKIMQ